MKKILVKCEIVFEIGEKKPIIDEVVVTEKNPTMANCAAITQLMGKYPNAIYVSPYMTEEINN